MGIRGKKLQAITVYFCIIITFKVSKRFSKLFIQMSFLTLDGENVER